MKSGCPGLGGLPWTLEDRPVIAFSAKK